MRQRCSRSQAAAAQSATPAWPINSPASPDSAMTERHKARDWPGVSGALRGNGPVSQRSLSQAA